MSVTQVGVTTGGDKKEYQGLSTDTKPTKTDCGAGSTFYELDTKKGFILDPNNICPTTTNNWWPI